MITQARAIELMTLALHSERDDVEVGAGLDDVAVVRLGSERIAVSVDFTNFVPLGTMLGTSTLSDRGYLLIIHNVSDLIASGASPLFGVVAVGFPRTFTEENIDCLARGIREAADACNVVVIGGDTKEAPCLALNATVIGRLGSSGHWARGGARPGDVLFLSGAVGGTSAAAFALSKDSVSDSIREKSRRVLPRPKLPLPLAEQLRSFGIRIAAIDLSDGLGIDTHRLADMSGVGIEIWAEDIPVHPLAKEVGDSLGIDAVKFAFGFGGDGQFLFSVDPTHETIVAQAGAKKIGRVLKSPHKRLLSASGISVLPNFGHQDFTGESSLDRLRRFLEEQSWLH